MAGQLAKLHAELAAAVSAYEAQKGNTLHYRTLAENQERRAEEAESALAQEREKREAVERRNAKALRLAHEYRDMKDAHESWCAAKGRCTYCDPLDDIIEALKPTPTEARTEPATCDDASRGLYRKYRVERTNGSSGPGGKHEHCEYFVLDLGHDKYAAPALRAYAQACLHEYRDLGRDLEAMAGAVEKELGAVSLPAPVAQPASDAAPPPPSDEGRAVDDDDRGGQ